MRRSIGGGHIPILVVAALGVYFGLRLLRPEVPYLQRLSWLYPPGEWASERSVAAPPAYQWGRAHPTEPVPDWVNSEEDRTWWRSGVEDGKLDAAAYDWGFAHPAESVPSWVGEGIPLDHWRGGVVAAEAQAASAKRR